MEYRMNKTILITGASRGIGRAIALCLAESGYQLLLNYYRSVAEAKELEQNLLSRGYRVLAYQADVTSKSQVQAMVGVAMQAFGKIDGLVNNAGIAQSKLFTDIEEAEWDQMMAVHLKGAYLCAKEVIPGMVARKQGKIINISSIWGMAGASCEVHYSAAKAGLIGMTKALAKELGPSGIQVNCVAPGIIETEMLADFTAADKQAMTEQTPLARLGTPQEIGALVAFLLAKEADFITGQVISPNGGFLI